MWERNQPNFSQRSINTISDDGRTIVSRGEISKDDAMWEQDLDLIYSRDE
jgi:hypothetical protein